MLELLIIGAVAALIGKAVSFSGSGSPTPTRTRNGEYEFEHRRVNGEWRAYIRRQPGYGGRPDDPHSTHRYRDGHGEHFVCWSEPIRSEAESEAISKLWAKKTDEYIEDGREF